MKVEIGESVIRSWLRHIETCELAELNWKPSPIWEKQNQNTVEYYFSKAQDNWPEAFGQNSLSQLLKQSEVDVLGLSYNSRNSLVHLVDIAFHSSGLNYGGNVVTSQRIFKKLVRSALISLTYFPDSSVTIYFVSPVATPAIAESVESACNRATEVFGGCPDINFRIILNDDFRIEILEEVLGLGNEVADTSELFLRSWQLIQPFHRPRSNEPSASEESLSCDAEVNREKVLITALYLSKYGHQHLGMGNQGNTIRVLAENLGTTAGSLRGFRDRFDRYVDESPRVGWDLPLSDELRNVLEKYSGLNERELALIISLDS